jgi:indolepyruvate ferredoxin oxidoreductase
MNAPINSNGLPGKPTLDKTEIDQLQQMIAERLKTISLDDKYSLESGRAFMSGIQALVRLPMIQRERDSKEGLNTAGFISGYRGSPLGGYDQALWKAKKFLAKNHVVFQPGVNEELGATAVWGTQQLDLLPPDARKYDGVFGIWYGKGPGVDRSVDVFKHANNAGTSKHGGVIAIAGDDHISKSSTAAHQSDHIFKACGFPVFYPSNVQEILDLGIHAFAMSRYTGLWSGFKTIQEIVESSSVVDVSSDRVNIVIPQDFVMPPDGVHMRLPDNPLAQEARLMDYKWYAALAYIRANKLNYTVLDSPNARLGLIASGKSFNDTRQALVDLGLDDDTCRALGIRLHKVNVVWPLEANIAREFATGLQEIIVIEEKRQVIEYQLKEELYNWRDDVRPVILGKFDEKDQGGEWAMPQGNWFLRAKADLSPAIIAKAIAARLLKMGVPADLEARMKVRLEIIQAKEQALENSKKADERTPWYCSGCPHNTSTKVPDGSRGLAGIGCHYMVTWMNRNTNTFSQMGGEGVHWVGQQPFSTEKHVFSNLGDGTFYHSGLLAIRQSISAKVNITYKILYNDAVAMTGGQMVETHLSVAQISRSLEAEGVKPIVIVSDDPEKFHTMEGLAPGITIHHRDELDTIQRQMREISGVSAIIYEQTCATEKRRRRKRDEFADPKKRLVINELVCEGCGDCSDQSSCMSVEPLETEFGRKRQINQSTCNKDYSCVKGFCPSFVTVEGGELKKTKAKFDVGSLPALKDPAIPALKHGVYGIVVAGVGGTGIITIGQLLGMAAHLEGKGVVTQDAAGLAQKGGATWSHVQIAAQQDSIWSTRVVLAEADLIIACDPIVAAYEETTARMLSGRTAVALNSHIAPTAKFIQNPDWQFPSAACNSLIEQAVGKEGIARVDAEKISTQLMGDSLYTNPIMLGFAWQQGWVPLTKDSLMRAIELNGVQIDNNKKAFELGRHAAQHPELVMKLLAPVQTVQWLNLSGRTDKLEDMVAKRVEFLTGYQNSSYAQRYQVWVNKVEAAEKNLGGDGKLSKAVAKYLFKLMAYKDEYEVARLHTDKTFLNKVKSMFEGDITVKYNLAPPLLAKKDDKGHLLKAEYGSYMRSAFGVMAKLKFLRGTAFDIFGYTQERKMERALIKEYEGMLEDLIQGLNTQNLALAVELASIPEMIRGYGHVKERHLEKARKVWDEKKAQWATQP